MAVAFHNDLTALKPLIERILEVARWAPSGDNSQPWRFKILNDHTVRIAVKRELTNVYEYKDGEPVLLSAGALLACMRLAASAVKMALDWTYEGYTSPEFVITATLRPDASVQLDPLLAQVPLRSVERKRMQKTPLTVAQKEALAQSLGDGLRIEWFETAAEIYQLSRLNAMAADVRLRVPEAYSLHARMLEWEKLESEDKMPVRTLPLNPLVRIMMRWAMGSWKRVHFMNRFLMGTFAPQLELELIPGMASAAHFAIHAVEPTNDAVALLRHGEAIQRFWLMATALGLGIQPSFATLIFAHYGRHHIHFSNLSALSVRAEKLAARAKQVYRKTDVEMDAMVFAGRIGGLLPHSPLSRSVRLPLSRLIVS